MTVQRATKYPPRMRRPIVPSDAVPIVEKISDLTRRRDAILEEADNLLAQRDKALVELWDVAGKGPNRPAGLTYGQIERVTDKAVRESNIRRIIERNR